MRPPQSTHPKPRTPGPVTIQLLTAAAARPLGGGGIALVEAPGAPYVMAQTVIGVVPLYGGYGAGQPQVTRAADVATATRDALNSYLGLLALAV